jgi:hypothetical protein
MVHGDGMRYEMPQLTALHEAAHLPHLAVYLGSSPKFPPLLQDHFVLRHRAYPRLAHNALSRAQVSVVTVAPASARSTITVEYPP